MTVCLPSPASSCVLAASVVRGLLWLGLWWVLRTRHGSRPCGTGSPPPHQRTPARPTPRNPRCRRIGIHTGRLRAARGSPQHRRLRSLLGGRDHPVLPRRLWRTGAGRELGQHDGRGAGATTTRSPSSRPQPRWDHLDRAHVGRRRCRRCGPCRSPARVPCRIEAPTAPSP